MTAFEWDRLIANNLCRITPDGTIVHPGLPFLWGMAVLLSMLMIFLWSLYQPVTSLAFGQAGNSPQNGLLSRLMIWPNRFAQTISTSFFTSTPWLLTGLKVITVALFLLVIWSGLAGTPLPSRNLATVLTWNIWWSGVILSVFFMGSAWCAICPWDALASWISRQRLWLRAGPESSLNLRVPKAFRNIWPALILFVALSWLELGVGITKAPDLTAMLALAMLVVTIAMMVLFERKAFCRFACPVGRTIGFYSQLAPVELRPVDPSICADCTTLECYHGSKTVDPCPTHQVMGTLKQNTFCTSCGNCARSCPSQNVGWRLRPPASEALDNARPHWDEAWFMIGLLALTGFHGLTMMEFWEDMIRDMGHFIGDSGQLLWSFSIGMMLAILIPALFYMAAIKLVQMLGENKNSFRDLFTRFAFTALPLAFAYHMAHNLSHLLWEGAGAKAVFLNPLGANTLPISLLEQQTRMNNTFLSPTALATLQAILLAAGFLLSVLVIRHRGAELAGGQAAHKAKWQLLPLLTFAATMTAYHLWLLMQPMIMRG